MVTVDLVPAVPVRAELKAAHRISWLQQRGHADHPRPLRIAAALARSGLQLTGLEFVGSFIVMTGHR